MGGLASLRTGDRVRIDLNTGTVNVLLSDEELAERRRVLIEAGGFDYTGAILEGAEKYQRIAQSMGLPRDNH